MTELTVRTGERRECPGRRVARPQKDKSGVEDALEGSRSIQGREAGATHGDAGAAGRGESWMGVEERKEMWGVKAFNSKWAAAKA